MLDGGVYSIGDMDSISCMAVVVRPCWTGGGGLRLTEVSLLCREEHMEGGGVKVRGTSVQRETYGGGEAGMVNRGILHHVFFVTSVFCLDLLERSAYEHGEVFNFSRTALQRINTRGG